MNYALWTKQTGSDYEGLVYEGNSVFVSSDLTEVLRIKADFESAYPDASYQVMCITPMPQEGPSKGLQEL